MPLCERFHIQDKNIPTCCSKWFSFDASLSIYNSSNQQSNNLKNGTFTMPKVRGLSLRHTEYMYDIHFQNHLNSINGFHQYFSFSIWYSPVQLIQLPESIIYTMSFDCKLMLTPEFQYIYLERLVCTSWVTMVYCTLTNDISTFRNFYFDASSNACINKPSIIHLWHSGCRI